MEKQITLEIENVKMTETEDELIFTISNELEDTPKCKIIED